MSVSLRLLTIITALFFLLFIASLVYKKKLSEKDSLLWIIASLGMLVVSIFPQIPDAISARLGLSYSAAIYFYSSIIFVLFIICYHSTRVSDLTEKNKDLAQKYALMENRLKKLEEKPKNRAGKAPAK